MWYSLKVWRFILLDCWHLHRLFFFSAWSQLSQILDYRAQTNICSTCRVCVFTKKYWAKTNPSILIHKHLPNCISCQLQLFLCLFFLTFITLCQSCQNIHLDTVCELNIQWKRQWAQIHSISLAVTHPYDRCFPQGALFSRTNEPVQFYKGLWETWELS